jgi:uncharacterized membrane protein
MDRNEHVVGPTRARSRAHPLHTTPTLAEERRAESPHEGAAVAVLIGLLLLATLVAATFVGVLVQTVTVLVALVTAGTALIALRTTVSAERTQLSAERTASTNERIAQLQLEKVALEPGRDHESQADHPTARRGLRQSADRDAG